jgi:hypothetical protein
MSSKFNPDFIPIYGYMDNLSQITNSLNLHPHRAKLKGLAVIFDCPYIEYPAKREPVTNDE